MSHPTRCAARAFVRRVSSFLCLLLILNFPAPPARASAPTAVKDSTAAAVPAAAAVEKTEPAAPTQQAALARTSAPAALQNPQTPYSGTPINIPGTIPASDFDNGGGAVAYHDNTAGCSGNCSYRSTDVDMWDRTVVQTSAGEWLEYTVNVTAAGTYTLVAEVASAGAGGTFHVEMNGVNVTGAMVIPNTGNWNVSRTITKTGVSLTAGQKVMRVYIDANGSGSSEAGSLMSFRVVDTSVAQQPFNGTGMVIPGTIPASDFDNGGEAVAYHDNTAGCSGNCSYRSTDVDMWDNVVYRTMPGEWLEYTVHVSGTNTYSINARVASDGPGGTFHIEFDGVDVTGPMTIPNTGGWSVFQTISKPGVTLTAGQHVMRIAIDSSPNPFDAGSFSYVDISGQSPLGGIPIALPGTIPASDFDNGGEAVAYHDNTAGCSGECSYRNTDVDLWSRTVIHTSAGEWLEYTVDVSTAGTYTLTADVASGGAGGTFHVEMDGINVTGPMTIPDTGGWNLFQTLTKTGVSLTAGRKVMRVYIDANGSGSSEAGSFNAFKLLNTSTPQMPFGGTPINLPGTVPASDFDNGGDLIAYHDNTLGCSGNCSYRNTDVDMWDRVVYATQAGEWLEYTVNVNSSGTYTLAAEVASEGQGGTFHVEFDGVNVTGPMTIPQTGGWSVFQTITKPGVNLTTGQKVMRLVMDSFPAGGSEVGSFNSIKLTADNPTPRPNGRVAYNTWRDGSYEIFTMNADGTGQTRVTNEAGDDTHPSWAPDGAKLAFQSTRGNNSDIYTMFADGYGLVRLTDDPNIDGSPAWSPSGTRIAYVSLSGGYPNIWVMNADGSNKVKLTTANQWVYDPAWSPDGTKLVFASEYYGNNDIFVINADGTGLTNLTPNTPSSRDTAPSWSPDGTKIAFVSTRHGTGTSNTQIYTMSPAGANVVRLTNNSNYDDKPAWSPDGGKLVFQSVRNSNLDVYTMNADGSAQTRITTDYSQDQFPDWGMAVSATAPTPTPTPVANPTPLPIPAVGGTVVADVVAFDQVFFYNRLGAVNPAGMIYALRRDVMPIDSSQGLAPGNVRLRPGKRARPIVLRVNSGQKLQVNFQNLLDPDRADDNQPATRTAGVHVAGLQLVGSIASDGSNVGQNPSSLVAPGGTKTYTFYAEREGNHLLYSTAATTGGEGDGGSLAMGLFGSVNVEPAGAEWYRSQITRQEMEYVTVGRTPGNQPIINYDALYPAGHPRAGQPVLRMMLGSEIVHSDLNAIITGPNHGRFPEGTYRPNATEPDRNQPFREFTVVYHDEIKAVQAFPIFEDQVFEHTLHSVRDAFAINYGTGGIGAEILANRFGVGPMANCTECLYEEFFLSTWAVADPAMIVDRPANETNQNGQLITGLKATKAFFPDDPSNVHHSYINDHVKFRVVHAGPKEHHIHHLHAHQWLNTPDDDNSTYLDSQALGPGYAFTTEITHNGTGNRNKVVGDSIFHCHFYPHFAMGMWELWRSHDVFEEGTPLDGDGRPVAGTRALPDGEIMAGTPIPGLVPLPTLAMPPMPQADVSIVNGQVNVNGAGNPGFPFFVPGVAGHRPPHPPLDTIDDGGLPRHVIVGGTFEEHHTRLNFDKHLLTADAKAVPESGTPTEVAAMNFHAVRQHPSFRPDGTPGNFITNGLPPKPGAPYADPCIDDAGNAFGVPRTYKGANIQLDVKFNKAGWHFPQQRISTLWADVEPTLSGQRPPEPLFFRANTNDCITFHHTNLVPRVYEQDDFQVKTPTDIMGQHIHLVKFDVTSSDGSGNGFNYEDGSFAPEEVIERIHAINAFGGLRNFNSNARSTLTPKPHPFFGTLGAQTTIQRWFADDVLNNLGQDRTLRTVFTHDHFGPSTHQQAGLYAGLVIEPKGSVWRHPETGQIFGGRFDGGPTGWRADILTPNPADSYREFLLEFADFQMAYRAGGGVDGQGHPVADPANAINPPAKNEPGLPFLLEPAEQCPGGVPLPCPEAIAAADVGTMVVNYRNEPVPLRVVNDPNVSNPTQAAGPAGDLSNVYRSDITRAFAPMNVQPNFYPPLTGGVFDRDPFTPLLRAYEDDRVQIRVLVGAHEEGHNFGVHGIKWRFEPGTDWNPAIPNNTGFRNNQMMGISEHFEFIIPTLPKSSVGSFADYLYQPGVAVDDQWNGLWGILRAYNRTQPDLLPLPNNPDGHGPVISNVGDFNGVCPKAATVREYDVSAVAAQNALDGGTLVYNPRPNQGGKLHDPTAILFVRTGDLDPNGKLIAGRPVEPLVLRANAGDCVEVTLRNKLPEVPADLDGFNTMPMIVNHFNANQVRPSAQVGLHPQLFFFDVTRSNGVNVGFNPVQTAQPGHTVKYRWYAGDLNIAPNGFASANPIEFGATNLSSSDPIKHSNKGAVGAFIIEPLGASWAEDANTRAQATVTHPGGVFREFVLIHQNDINLRFGGRYDSNGNPAAVPNLAEAEDPEDSGQKAFNYRTEPLWKRMGFEPDTPLEQTREFDFTNVLSNSQVGGDPVTPVFTAAAGVPVRFRVLMPGGHARNSVFNLHGHIWEQEPFMFNSTVIGSNPLSEWKGMMFGIGAGSHFDILPKYGAGGRFAVPGDYLYRNQMSFMFDGGMWGIFRVSSQ